MARCGPTVLSSIAWSEVNCLVLTQEFNKLLVLPDIRLVVHGLGSAFPLFDNDFVLDSCNDAAMLNWHTAVQTLLEV